jgi:hypothetical protein
MGYDVHIERVPCQDDTEPPTITLEEWTAFVERDPDMQMTPSLEVVNPMTGEVIRWRSEGMATWIGSSEVDDPQLTMVLRLVAGSLVTRFPCGDDERIRKLHAIANALGALVRGDEGEIYREEEFSS